MLSENVAIINTCPIENPVFVEKLVNFLNSLGIESEIIQGYAKDNPLDRNPTHIILTGAPVDANYSLAQKSTQKVVNKAFGYRNVNVLYWGFDMVIKY